MFKFFKKKEPNDPKELDIISKTASLLIHAAKIDENYTNKEKLGKISLMFSLPVFFNNFSKYI